MSGPTAKIRRGIDWWWLTITDGPFTVFDQPVAKTITGARFARWRRLRQLKRVARLNRQKATP